MKRLALLLAGPTCRDSSSGTWGRRLSLWPISSLLLPLVLASCTDQQPTAPDFEVAAPSFAVSQSQITLDFEDDLVLASGFVIGHRGFDFTGSSGDFSWVRSGSFAGFLPVSGSWLVWSNGGATLESSRATSFTFFSAWMGASHGTCASPPVDQTVRGFRGAVEVFTQTVTLACGSPFEQFTFNFTDIDRVRFDGAGTQPDVVNLVLDDLVVSDVIVLTIDKELLEGPPEVGIALPGATTYVFEIDYTGPAAQIQDAVPAEFEVTNLSASDGTATSSTKGNASKSATQITWDVPAGSHTLTVTIQTRESPGRRNSRNPQPPVFKPTSCGPLPINDGATAYEVDDDGNLVLVEVVDPDTGEITLERVVIVGPSNALEVEAVAGVKQCDEG